MIILDESVFKSILDRLDKIEITIRNINLHPRSENDALLKDIMLSLSSTVNKIDQKVDNLSNDITAVKIDVGAIKIHQAESMRTARDKTVQTRWYYGIVLGVATVAVGIAKLFF